MDTKVTEELSCLKKILSEKNFIEFLCEETRNNKVVQKYKCCRDLTHLSLVSRLSSHAQNFDMRREKKWRVSTQTVTREHDPPNILQQFGDFMREGAVVIDADELEVGFIDGFIVAAETVVVSAIGEFIVG